MEEIPKWLQNPMVKNHPSIPQVDITIPNPSLESNMHFSHPHLQAMNPYSMTCLSNLLHKIVA